MARSTRPLSYGWFEAITSTPEEAEDLSFEVNARRAEARMDAKGGRS